MVVHKMGPIVWIFFSSRRRHTRCYRDWSSDVCSSDLLFMSDIRLSRRRFLGATAGGAAALAAAGPWAPRAFAGKGVSKAHIAIQMWSVRDMFAADPEGTLR